METTTKQKTGTISRWIKSRGFGFVVVQSNHERSETYYLHTSKVTKGAESLAYGATVRFNVDPLREGRYLSAIDAEIVEAGNGGAL